MDGLRPQRIKATKSKRIEPLVTPEARSFREATSKLDNWTNHRRITDYLSKDPTDVDRGETMSKIEEKARDVIRYVREATGKLDNWTNHHRITDYLEPQEDEAPEEEPKPKEQAPRDKAPE